MSHRFEEDFNHWEQEMDAEFRSEEEDLELVTSAYQERIDFVDFFNSAMEQANDLLNEQAVTMPCRVKAGGKKHDCDLTLYESEYSKELGYNGISKRSNRMNMRIVLFKTSGGMRIISSSELYDNQTEELLGFGDDLITINQDSDGLVDFSHLGIVGENRHGYPVVFDDDGTNRMEINFDYFSNFPREKADSLTGFDGLSALELSSEQMQLLKATLSSISEKHTKDTRIDEHDEHDE